MRRLLVLLLLVPLAGCSTDDVAAPAPPAASTPASPQGSPAGCPAAYGTASGPWVPQLPTTETPGRLVPDADPVEALICRYEAGGALDGQVLLQAGRDLIRHDLLVPEKLAGQDRACTLIGGAMVPHLMRLTYADGDLWVSATQDPNSCTDSVNGDFVSSAYLGRQLADSYDAGSWVPLPADVDGCRAADGRGRLGQEHALLPQGWESVTVCRPAADPAPAPRELGAATAEQVATLLGQLRTEPGGSSCSGSARTSYDLLARYPAGPPVLVMYTPGCAPPMRNLSLDATPSAEQGARLEDLLRRP